MFNNTDDTGLKWNWLRRLAALGLAGTAVIIALIAAGTFDPQPLGGAQTTISALTINLPAASELREPISSRGPFPPPPFSLKMTVTARPGAPDSLHGLLLAPDLLVALSPLGELAIWEHPGEVVEEGTAVFPRQPWPHVRPAGRENEIWIDCGVGETAVRINGELAWTGEPLSGPPEVFYWGRSYNAAGRLEFGEIRLFWP
jgi:hypothetical protein